MSATQMAKIAELTEQLGAVTEERDTQASRITELESSLAEVTQERDAARAEVEPLREQVAAIADLETAQSELNDGIEQLATDRAEFDQRVAAEAARIAASTGTSTPADVTPDAQKDEKTRTLAEFNAMSFAERADFIRSGGKIED